DGIRDFHVTGVQTCALPIFELLKAPPSGEEDFLLDLFSQRIPAGVDDAAYVKAAFLSALAKGKDQCPLIDRTRAVELLGTMLGEIGRASCREREEIAVAGRG